MLKTRASGDPHLIAHVADNVAIADTAFNETAAVAQPVTGYLLAQPADWPMASSWLG